MTAKRPKKQKRRLRFLTRAAGVAALAVLIGSIMIGCTTVASAPDVTKLEWESSTVIYDRTGSEMYRLHAGKNRT